MTSLIPICASVTFLVVVSSGVVWHSLTMKLVAMEKLQTRNFELLTTAMYEHAEFRAKVAQADLRLALASHGVDLKNTLSLVKQDLTIALEDAKQHMHSAATKLEGDAEIVKTHLQQLADETFARSHSARLPRSVERSK